MLATSTAVLLLALPSFTPAFEASDPRRQEPDVATDAAADAEAVRDTRVRRFCAAVESTIANGDRQFVARAIDLDAMLDRGIGDVEVDATFDRDFRGGLASNFDYAGQMVEAVTELGADFEFLRVLPADPRATDPLASDLPRVLFRASGDPGLNYHEFTLRLDDDHVRIMDIEVHVLGEPLSTVFGRAYLTAAADADRNLIAKLVGGKSEYVGALPTIVQMRESLDSAPERTLELWETLPESVQRLPEILLLRVHAARAVDDEIYSDAMQDFARWHPSSSALDLMTFDVHVIAEDHDAALASVDRIDERVGGDPYLDFLRAGVHFDAGRKGRAVQFARVAMEREPRLGERAHWTLIEFGLADEKYDMVLELLLALERDYDIVFGDLAEFEVYAGFVASPAGERWRTRPSATDRED